MENHRPILVGIVVALFASGVICQDAPATTVRFDDAYAALGESSNPATFYQADLGVTFTGQYHGVVGGQGNGDVGNWELRGTNGSALLGINTNFTGSPTINFDTAVTGFSVDVGVPEFGPVVDMTLRATGFLNGSVAEIRTVSITTTGNINGEWDKLTLTEFVDSVKIEKISGTANAFGVDNYRFSFAEVVWTAAAGGNFFSSSNWDKSAVPPSSAISIDIQPQFGGTVSGMSNTTAVQDFTLGAAIGTGSLDISPTGSLIVSNTTDIQSSGRITGEGSFISQESTFTLNGTIDLANSLQVTAQNDMTNNGQVIGNGILDVGIDLTNNGSIQIGGALHAANRVFNNATINLTTGGSVRADNSLTNNPGALITGDGLIAANVFNNGTIRVAAGDQLTIDDLASTTFLVNSNAAANPAQIELLGGTLEIKGDLINGELLGVPLPGRIIGHGTLIVDGTLTNAFGTLAFSGNTDILGNVDNQDTIIVSGNSRATFFDDVVHNGTDITVNNGSIAVFFGNVSGAGPFTGNGTIQFEGTFSPGNSPAISQFGGDVDFGFSSTLNIELGGLTPGTGHDQLAIAGDLSLGGTLDVTDLAGFTLNPGMTFELITFAGNLTGTFNNIVNSTGLAGLILNVTTDADSVNLTLDALAGDLNLDGFVGINDLNIVLASWNQNVTPGTWQLGDPSNDGFVGIDDLNAVLGNWNAGTPPTSTTNIPEPTTLALLTLGVLTTLRRQRA